MADDSVKELVSRWTLDTSSWADEVKKARATLSEATEQDKANAAAAKASSDTIVASLKVQQEQQRLIVEQQKASGVTAQTNAAIAKAAADQAKAAADKTIAGLKAQIAAAEAKAAAAATTAATEKAAADAAIIAAQKKAAADVAAANIKKASAIAAVASTQQAAAAEAAAHIAKMHQLALQQEEQKKIIATRDANIKKIQQEIAELRLENAELGKQHKEQKEATERPSLMRLAGGPITTIAGGQKTLLGGATSSLISGLVGGGQLAAGMVIFETLERGLDTLTEKVKEFIEDSGGLQKVLYTFQELSEGKGFESNEFFDQLIAKTHHLVDEIDLLREANTFMQSGLKISKEQMLTLTEATVSLARSQGKDAKTAVQALTRAFLTGGRGAMQLARVVGIQTPALMQRGFSQTQTMAERQQQIMDHLYEAIVKRWKEMGDVPLTYTDRIKQVQVTSQELFEQVAQGAVKSAGFANFMDLLGATVDKLGGMESVAYKLGDAIGNAVGMITNGIRAAIPVVEDFFGLLKEAGKIVFDFTSGFTGLDKAADDFKSRTGELHPVLNQISDLFIDLATNIRIVINNWTDMLDLIPKTKNLGKQAAEPLAELGRGILSAAGVDTKKLGKEFNKAKEADTSIDLSRLRTPEGTVLDSTTVDKDKLAQFVRDTKEDIDALHKHYTEEVKRIQSDTKTSPETKERAINSITRGFNQNVLDIKEENAEKNGFKYKWTTADFYTDAARKKEHVRDVSVEGEDNGKAKPTTDFPDDSLQRRHAAELMQARLKLRRDEAEATLEIVKSQVAEENEVNERAYKHGQETIKEYYDTKKRLAAETLRATLASIGKEAAAEKEKIDASVRTGQLFPDVGNVQKQAIDVDTQRKAIKAYEEYHKSTSQAALGAQEDADKARRNAIDLDVEHQKKASDAIVEIVKHQYEQGMISAKTYYDASLEAIMKNVDATQAAEAKKRSFTTNSQEENIASLKREIAVLDEAKKSVDALTNSFIEQEFQKTQSRFGSLSNTLAAHGALIKQANSPNVNAESLINTAQQKAVIDGQIQALTTLLAQTDQYSETWYKIYDSILKATQQSEQLNQQMRELSSVMPGIGSAFQALAKLGGQLFGSKYARGLEASLAAGGQMLSDISKHHDAIFGVKTQQMDPRLKAVIDAAEAASTGVINSAKKSASGLDGFASALERSQQMLLSALDGLTEKLRKVTSAPLEDTEQTKHMSLAPSAEPPVSAESPIIIKPLLQPVAPEPEIDRETKPISEPPVATEKPLVLREKSTSSTASNIYKERTSSSVATHTAKERSIAAPEHEAEENADMQRLITLLSDVLSSSKQAVVLAPKKAAEQSAPATESTRTQTNVSNVSSKTSSASSQVVNVENPDIVDVPSASTVNITNTSTVSAPAATVVNSVSQETVSSVASKTTAPSIVVNTPKQTMPRRTDTVVSSTSSPSSSMQTAAPAISTSQRYPSDQSAIPGGYPLQNTVSVVNERSIISRMVDSLASALSLKKHSSATVPAIQSEPYKTTPVRENTAAVQKPQAQETQATKDAENANRNLADSSRKSSNGLDTLSTAVQRSQQTLISALDDLSAKLQEVTHAPTATSVNAEAPPIVDVSGMSEPESPQLPEQKLPHVDKAADKAASGLENFTHKLVGTIDAVSSFASTITNAQSASAGAVGGAMGGAGLGASLTQGMGKTAQMLGPLAGIGIGATMGAIFGQKQNQVQHDIDKLNVSFKGIMDSYSTNNQSLQATIGQLQQLILQAQMMQSSTKKGGQQYAQLIQQYNEQITQLKDQAASTLNELHQQLLVLSEPTPYQDIAQGVQEIIQQYTKFAGAAENAQQLAEANDFLAMSLQKLGVSYTDQLRQDEQQAIQQALSLNELYNQRNQLNREYLLQVRSIMGQGTVTRGVTQAQSKFSQLYDLQVNHANQLDTINQQISLAQYQVSSYQQIFNMATTKAGLEMQLLQLQEVGVNQDMARIAAMMDLLQVMQQTGFSITNLNNANVTNPNQLQTSLLSTLLQALGGNGPVGQVASASPTQSVTGGTLPSGIGLTQTAANAYGSRAIYGYAAYRAQNLI